jgi:hypothetical protein
VPELSAVIVIHESLLVALQGQSLCKDVIVTVPVVAKELKLAWVGEIM